MSADDRNRPGLQRATGRDYDEWFALLDEWGAPHREYRAIADWLEEEHGFSQWWAQKVIVEYEQARGLREPGARADGTFTITASKTVAAGAERLFEAFTDAALREQWLPGVELRERTSQPGRSARFDWHHDGTRVNVGFTSSSAHKAQVSVEHARLPNSQEAAERKAFWQDRLAALKDLLEA